MGESASTVRDAIARQWPQLPVDAALEAEVSGAAHPSELYLARLAARGHAGAQQVLETQVLARVSEKLARLAGADVAADAMQKVRERLLMGAAPALRQYAGSGPLKAWVTVVAVRALADLKPRAPGDEVADQRLASGDVELELLRARYAEVFRVALQHAISSLERRQRVALRMTVVDGMSPDTVAAVFHTHRATVFRWLSEAREHLRVETLSRAAALAGIAPSELSSIGRLVQRHTDFSMRRLLRGGSPIHPERRPEGAESKDGV